MAFAGTFFCSRAAAGASVRGVTLTTASTDYSTKTNIDDYGAIGGGRRRRTKPMEQCGGSASSSATNMRIQGRWSARWPSFHPRTRQIMSVVLCDSQHTTPKYGYPTTRYSVRKSSYIAEFDPRTRNPIYVMEFLTREKLRNIQITRSPPPQGPPIAESGSSGSAASPSSSPTSSSPSAALSEPPTTSTSTLAHVRDQFTEETTIPAHVRNKLSHFFRSGFDRGHLAAARNHRDDALGFTDTFSLVNICPQVGRGFNRDYWARLEKFVADTVCEHGEAVVITGPMFLPKEVAQRDDGENGNGPRAQVEVDEQEKTTGFLHALASFFRRKGSSETDDRSKFPRGPSTEITVTALGTLPSVTHVPTHFFKIVLVNDKLLACFLLPNCAIESEVPVTFFLRSLQELESLSGITFFPEMRAERKAEWDSVEEAALRRIRAELQARSTEQAASAGKVLGDKKQGGGKKEIEHLCEVVRCKLKTFRFDRDEKQGHQGQGTPKRDREHQKTPEF